MRGVLCRASSRRNDRQRGLRDVSDPGGFAPWSPRARPEGSLTSRLSQHIWRDNQPRISRVFVSKITCRNGSRFRAEYAMRTRLNSWWQCRPRSRARTRSRSQRLSTSIAVAKHVTNASSEMTACGRRRGRCYGSRPAPSRRSAPLRPLTRLTALTAPAANHCTATTTSPDVRLTRGATRVTLEHLRWLPTAAVLRIARCGAERIDGRRSRFDSLF